ncbi:MAG TPA: PilZ domain-containing protein [Bdellovibrio sp.]|uniref:flagellar brake protein n=1 Tax=Bdellovibrio sp. TaxID=28201 RepID=UPI002EE47D0E
MILGQSTFKPVPISERKEIFKEIAKDKLQLIVRGAAPEACHVEAVSIDDEDILFCHRTDDAGGLTTDSDAVLNFDHGNERYFMKAYLRSSKDGVFINTNFELFQLQRRANVRVVIPETFDALFSLHGHGGKKYFKDCKVVDVSAGGVRIEFQGAKPDLKENDIVEGTLRLGTRRPMKFDLQVRFVNKRVENGDTVYTAGTMFMNIDKTMETRLLSLITDLQRELFLKSAKDEES